MKGNKQAELLWAKHKYEVMWHSQNHYLAIRERLKQEVDINDIQSLIDEALVIKPTKGSIVNTFDHLWGYFKKICEIDEKKQYIALKENFINEKEAASVLIEFIQKLTIRYKVDYLLNSSLLYKFDQ